MKYEDVSEMSESSMLEAVKNCLIRRPKVRIALGLASNNFIYLLSNTALCAGCFGNDFILEAYCIVRKETRCRHIGYSYRLTAMLVAFGHILLPPPCPMDFLDPVLIIIIL